MSSSAPDSGAAPQRRLLILPTEVAGYASRVAGGFRELGWAVDILDLSGNPFRYAQEEAGDSRIAALNRVHVNARNAAPWQGRWMRLRSKPAVFRAAVVAVPTYDAVVYLFGRTLLGRLDPWLVRRRGGRVLAVFLGSDARPAYMSGHYTNSGRSLPVGRTFLRTLLSAARVRKMESVADIAVCHPAYGHFFSTPFVNWLALGMPSPKVPGIVPAGGARTGVVLVHAPSAQRQKGTAEIVAAVESIRSRGVKVELVLLEGLPNDEVTRAIRESDAVIDELYSDTPLAGLASEAAAQGRAVLTFGYAQRLISRDSTLSGLPVEHYRDPDELESAIERVIVDPEWRESIARAVRTYVSTTCQPVAVAQRLQQLIDEGAPEEWLVDPASVDYCEGWGAPREATRTAIARYVKRMGSAALLLPPSGRARSAVLSFARTAEQD